MVCVCVCYWPPFHEVFFSQLLGGDVPTSGIDNSGPRLRSLFLHGLLIEPAPPSFPSVQFPSGGGSPLLPHHPSHKLVAAWDHPPTQASPFSVPAYRNPQPTPPSSVTSGVRILLPALAPAMPDGLPSPPLPCCLQNIF